MSAWVISHNFTYRDLDAGLEVIANTPTEVPSELLDSLLAVPGMVQIAPPTAPVSVSALLEDQPVAAIPEGFVPPEVVIPAPKTETTTSPEEE